MNVSVRSGPAWRHLTAFLDRYARGIVGWSMRKTLHTEIDLEGLSKAVERRQPELPVAAPCTINPPPPTGLTISGPIHAV